MSVQESVRVIALSLPETTEQDHHGMPSFRVAGKIFATIPDPRHVRIMLDEAGILAAAAESPTLCTPSYWGKRLACVVVDVTAQQTFERELSEMVSRYRLLTEVSPDVVAVQPFVFVEMLVTRGKGDLGLNPNKCHGATIFIIAATIDLPAPWHDGTDVLRKSRTDSAMSCCRLQAYSPRTSWMHPTGSSR